MIIDVDVSLAISVIFDVVVTALWSRTEKKNTEKIAIKSFTVPRARE